MTMRIIATACAAAMTIAGAQPASAQAYPSKPIRIITGGVGGSNDLISRE